MASPAPTTASADANEQQKKLEQITFRFCTECSNMLYPKEDEDARTLQFVCRTCNFTDKATSSCIFRNVLNNAAGETAGVTQDVGSDPTVGTAPHSHESLSTTQPDCKLYPILLCTTCENVVMCEVCQMEGAVSQRVVDRDGAPVDTSTKRRLSFNSIQSADSLDRLMDLLNPLPAMEDDVDMFQEPDAATYDGSPS